MILPKKSTVQIPEESQRQNKWQKWTFRLCTINEFAETMTAYDDKAALRKCNCNLEVNKAHIEQKLNNTQFYLVVFSYTSYDIPSYTIYGYVFIHNELVKRT